MTTRTQPPGERGPTSADATDATGAARLSERLEGWLIADGEKTLGSLVHTFGDKSFAILLVVLLGVPALPVPTGGVTHVFELVAMLVALQLIAGRREVWLPQRWRTLTLAGPRRERFIAGLMRLIRRLERYSRPRFRLVFHSRFTDLLFGLPAIVGTAGAFLAPPFSGLDTLPALGVVVLSLSALLEDGLLTLAGIFLTATGITLELALGAAAVHGISSILN